MTTAQVCSTKWGTDARHVTASMRAHVFAVYGIPKAEWKDYELDHLIPRSSGGADDVLNLKPQKWVDARKKDVLEVRLHKLVCNHELRLTDAQEWIRRDWRKAYQLFVEGR